MNWRDCLADELRRLTPTHICALDAEALAAARCALPDATISIETPAPLAIVMGALEGLDAASARTRLAHARDFLAPCILAIANAQCALDRLAFLAIGYDMLGFDETENIAIYRHDLATYKQVPDWLNARFWAHPERWKP